MVCSRRSSQGRSVGISRREACAGEGERDLRSIPPRCGYRPRPAGARRPQCGQNIARPPQCTTFVSAVLIPSRRQVNHRAYRLYFYIHIHNALGAQHHLPASRSRPHRRVRRHSTAPLALVPPFPDKRARFPPARNPLDLRPRVAPNCARVQPPHKAVASLSPAENTAHHRRRAHHCGHRLRLHLHIHVAQHNRRSHRVPEPPAATCLPPPRSCPTSPETRPRRSPPEIGDPLWRYQPGTRRVSTPLLTTCTVNPFTVRPKRRLHHAQQNK
ncbi:hypothetical protein B0H16DRAFT_170595 [Mycena metata]|uniref:Uncharacterized protein n=1 Tax=Mycena metata TaxID=1033252 RepID=A0AAD7I1W5_9AGAR|nr:hypothetical protein B0H16DRAFT_170595 [Mycena metata]